MKASDVFDAARGLLTDEDKASWTDAEFFTYLNDGRAAACIMRPDLFAVTEPFSCVAGAAQTLPNASRRLLDVVRNLSHQRKRAITPVDADVINRHRPNRAAETQRDEVQHFIYDELDPSTFEVYPPAKAAVQIEIRYARPPVAVASLDTELAQEGDLAFGYIDYVLARAFQKESLAAPGMAGRADAHMALFTTRFGGDAAAQAQASPNATREGSGKTQ